MEETSRILGKKIRDAREEKGMSQKDLGGVLGYSPMAISHFENGIRELKLSDLQKLACYFEKPLSFFFPTSMPNFYRAQPNTNPEIVKSLECFDKYIETLNE